MPTTLENRLLMDAKLKIVSGAKPATLQLKLPLTIGRSKSANLTVPHSLVSRNHCEIYEESGMLVVHDLGSSNGTFINGETIDEPTFLYPGEQLQIGKVLFEAEYEAPEMEIVETEIEFISDDADDEEEGAAEEPNLPKVVTDGKEDAEPVDPAELIDFEVDYTESSEGSFLGIPDINIGEEPPAQDSASQISIHDGAEKPAGPVDGGDSALNSFFDNLDE